MSVLMLLSVLIATCREELLDWQSKNQANTPIEVLDM